MKSNKMKLKIIISFCINFLPLITFSQEWLPYSSNEKLQIDYKYMTCNDDANGIHQEKVLFKYTNLTENSLDVSLSITSSYINNGKEYSTKPDVKIINLILSPGQVLEGTCQEKNKALFLFSKMIDTEASALKNFTIIINEIK